MKKNPNPVKCFITGGKYTGSLGLAHYTNKERTMFTVQVEGINWQFRIIKKEHLAVGSKKR